VGDEATGCTFEAPVTARSIPADELAARVWFNSGSPNGEELAKRLTREGWADVLQDGSLVPSQRLTRTFWPRQFVDVDDVG